MDFYGNVYITGPRVTNMQNFICPVPFWGTRTHPLLNPSVISLLIYHFATFPGLYSTFLPQDRGRIFKEKKKKKWGLNTEYCYLYLVWSNLRDQLHGETGPCFPTSFANHLLNLAFTSFSSGFTPRNPMHIYACEGLFLQK